MADLTVTIGADLTELEKGLGDAGKTVKKGAEKIENPFKATAEKFSSAAGIGGMIAGPVGMLVGQFIDAFSNLISKVGEYVKELIAYSVEMRNLSIATGVSIGELQKLESLSKASGISLTTLAHAFNQFDKSAGTARIKGSELNNMLAKMGIGMDRLATREFTAIDGLKALAAAYEAGTDAQVLAYYGNIMYGSSFEQLLPIIKRGQVAIDEYARRTAYSNGEASYTLARISDDWDNFWHSFKIVAVEAIAYLANILYEKFDGMIAGIVRIVAQLDPEKAGKMAEMMINPASSPAQRGKQLMLMTAGLSDEDKKKFFKGYLESAGPEGKKLEAFGLAPAGGASSLQQMGGGDIFGAIAFSPLTAIEKNTRDTVDAVKELKSPPEESILRPENINAK
jgi:hypothetical protein